MYSRPSRYSCQGRRTRTSVRSLRAARKPPGVCSRLMEIAENTNDRPLHTNAHSKPNCMTLMPANIVPIVSAVHCVACVSELAVCSSSREAITGRIAVRPLVKNGEAKMSSALSV